MKFSTNVTLCPVTHPRLHKALFQIRTRSKAEVFRRYAEIGLLFEMGMLNFNTTGDESTQEKSNTAIITSKNEDKFDDEIIEIFGMASDVDDKGDGQ